MDPARTLNQPTPQSRPTGYQLHEPPFESWSNATCAIFAHIDHEVLIPPLHMLTHFDQRLLVHRWDALSNQQDHNTERASPFSKKATQVCSMEHYDLAERRELQTQLQTCVFHLSMGIHSIVNTLLCVEQVSVYKRRLGRLRKKAYTCTTNAFR